MKNAHPSPKTLGMALQSEKMPLLNLLFIIEFLS